MLMSRIRRGTEEEWRTFAREVFEIRYKLMDVFMKYQELLPRKVSDKCFRIVDVVDNIRSDLETEMFNRGGPKDTKVWYPGADAWKKTDK